MNGLDALTASPEVSLVTHTIQLSVAPVFLLAGIGAFLNVCTGRLARIIDRARTIEGLLPRSRGAEHDRLLAEIRTLDRRMGIVNGAILLSVLSALLICAVVVLLFASNLVSANMGRVIALLFIGSMLSIGAGFATFIREIRMSSGVVRIRNEILFHQEEQERGPKNEPH